MGSSASSDRLVRHDRRAGRALTNPAHNQPAAFDELTFGKVVLECVDEPIAPDGVVHITRIPSPANRHAVVKAGVHPRDQLHSGVITPEALRFQLRPHGVVLVARKSVLAEAILQPVISAVIAGVGDRSGASTNTEPRTAVPLSTFSAVVVVVLAGALAAAFAVLVLARHGKRRATCVAGCAVGSPLFAQPCLPGRLSLAVSVGAGTAKAGSPVRAARSPAVFAEPFRDAPGLCRFVSHVPILTHVEAGGFSLRRWCETVPHLVQEGNHQ